MTERGDRLLAAFEAARAEPDPVARERILQEACAGDATMLAELRRLLAVDVPADFLADAPDTTPRELGEFRLLHVLAEGGSGVIWVAEQPRLQRQVAIKVLTAGPGTPSEQIVRFHREPLSVSKLAHPNIVPVYADGIAGNSHWFAMQLVDGHSLAHEIELQRRPRDGESPLLPPYGTGQWFAAIARLCADAAGALHAAHGGGIVHRDIKPQNLLLDRSGRVLVADFGIARDERFGSLTEVGTIAGSWHYMSPEQARVATDTIDRRTDIYSLGIVLYELLTLRRPYEGQSAQEVIDRIRRGQPTPIRTLAKNAPRDLETICLAAMAPAAKDRYATADELAADLRRFVAHEAILRQPPSAAARLRNWCARKQRPLTVVATALVAVAIGLAAQSAIQAAERSSSLQQRCAELVARPSLDDAKAADLSRLWQDLADTPANAQPVVRAAKDLLRTYREGLIAARERALRDAESLGDSARQSDTVFAAQGSLWRAHAIAADDRTAAALSDNPLNARVDIAVVAADGSPVAAEITAVYLEPLSGLPAEEVSLGTAPVAGCRLRWGLNRLVVRSAEYGVREFTREFDFMQRGRVELRLGPREVDTAGMLRIPSGDLQLEPFDPVNIDRSGPPSGLAGQVVHVAEFWIDRTEVTVAEYRAFLRASGRPDRADLANLGPEFDRWPITKVTWEEAAAYAEYYGKRLPSLAEWMLAARGAGPAPRRLPWVGTGYFGNCKARRGDAGVGASDFECWLRLARPVDEDPRSGTPEGVLELYGNVAEWTETLGVDREGDRIVPRLDRRYAAGGFWYASTHEPPDDLTNVLFCDEGPMHREYYIGFRCVRSTTR